MDAEKAPPDNLNECQERRTRHYFIDESGSPKIFKKRGRLDLKAGKHFFLGLTDIREVWVLSNALNNLRVSLQKDPKLSGISSLSPQRRKTAFFFHACNDHQEVRERVFTLLCRPEYEFYFYAVIRQKQAVVNYVKLRQEEEPDYVYHENQLYYSMMKRLFHARFHEDDKKYNLYVAERGNTTRQTAILSAVKQAQEEYSLFRNQNYSLPDLQTILGPPAKYEGLQVVDYCLWALQRLFERNEVLYWKRLWNSGKVRCVIDLDDKSQYDGGMIYHSGNPLTGEFRP